MLCVVTTILSIALIAMSCIAWAQRIRIRDMKIYVEHAYEQNRMLWHREYERRDACRKCEEE